MAPLRYGIVGLGWAGRVHQRVLSSMRGEVEIIGVCDVDASALERCPHERFSSIEDLLEAQPDAISICTPHDCHAEQAQVSVNHGVACLVEKPLAITPADCDRLAAQAEAQSVPLAVVSQYRFDPMFSSLREAVQGGELGAVISVDIDLKWHKKADYYRGWRGRRARAGGGVVMMQAIHTLDVAQLIAGEVRSVAACFRRITPAIEIEDNAYVLLDFASGACGTLRASTTSVPWHGTTLHVMGERGYIRIHDRKVVHWGERSRADTWRMNLAARARHHAAAVGKRYFGPGHTNQLRAFVRAVRHGEPPAVDPHEGGRLVRLVAAIERAACEGCWVEVE